MIEYNLLYCPFNFNSDNLIPKKRTLILILVVLILGPKFSIF